MSKTKTSAGHSAVKKPVQRRTNGEAKNSSKRSEQPQNRSASQSPASGNASDSREEFKNEYAEAVQVREEALEEASDFGDETETQEALASEEDRGGSSGLFRVLLSKTIFCVSLGVFAYALSALGVLLWGYYSSQKEYEDLNKDTVTIGTTAASENNPQNSNVIVEIPGNSSEGTGGSVPFLEISVDERKLKALNEDYAFYIVIPGTNIQYPVVQGDDNSHYLRYTYSNKENTAGAIALDYRTDRSAYLEPFKTIISGHNRQDGTMFSDLANYRDESFRDAYPYVYIVMDGREYVYEIYAFYAMEPVAVCYNPYTADDVYRDFVDAHNTYNNDIQVSLEDHIITMYTCNEDSSMRYLCHAVLRGVYEL